MGMAMGGYCFFLAGLTLGDPKTLNKKKLSFFDNGRIKKSSRRISSGIISPKNFWSQVFGPLRPPHDGLQGPHLLDPWNEKNLPRVGDFLGSSPGPTSWYVQLRLDRHLVFALFSVRLGIFVFRDFCLVLKMGWGWLRWGGDVFLG